MNYPTFFGSKHTIVERIAQTMDDCKISFKIQYPLRTVSFKGWMAATLSVTNTDILIQRKEGCN